MPSIKLILKNAPMGPGFQVQLETDSTRWAAGKTRDEALGDWMRTHGHLLNVEIEDISKYPK